MVKNVQVFITHFVTKDFIFLNDMLVEAVTFMEKITDYPHETIVIYYSPDGSETELFDRLPKNVKLVKNDALLDSAISILNKVLQMAEDYFVILQNDIRVSHGWLTALVNDFGLAESKFGKRCIMSMRFIPYHYIPPEITGIEQKYPEFWTQQMFTHYTCNDINIMRNWCKQYGFKFENNMVYSISKPSFTDDGHMLMMFMSTRNCFDPKMEGIGYYDEKFLGWGYCDCDLGIRTLMKGFKNLQSQTSLIGHRTGLTTTQPKFNKSPVDNRIVFIEKWGESMFNEMQTGQLWIRLHRENK